MKNATGTKTKVKKIAEHHQPKEIQAMDYGKAQTTARKAFLAAKLAEISALPNRSAKIVGGGSYAYVAEYEVTEVAGRLRHRGHCQVCGGSQVAEDVGMEFPRLVNHGYKRPGDGYLIGRCPGVGEPALEHSQKITDQLLASANVQKINTASALEAATKEETAALRAVCEKNGVEVEPGAYAARPSEPRAERVPSEAGKAARATFHKEKAAWAKRFPKHARYEAAQKVRAEARNADWQAEEMRRHFQYLVDLKLLGKPLMDEVVV